MNTKLITLGIALFLGFSVTAQKKEVRNAEKEIENKNFSKALAELEQAESSGILEEKEKWIVRYYNAKGNAYLGNNDDKNQELEDLKKSADAFNKALAIDSSDEDAEMGIQQVRNSLINSAIEDQNKNDFKTSKEKLYTSYQLNKKDTIHLYYAAGSAINAEEYREAVKYFEELLEMGYDGSRTEYYAVNPETGEKENFGSDKGYRDLMVKSGEYNNPEDVKTPSVKAEIAKNISRIYIQLEEPEKAMKSLQVAKEMNPDDVALLQAEADLYYQMGDLEKYQELMNKVKDKAPDDPMVYYNLGVSAEQLEDLDAAKEFYIKAIELDPDYVASYLNIASVILSKEEPLVNEMNELGMSAADNKRYEQLNKKKRDLYEDALPYLQKAFEVKPENKGVIQTLMNIHYQLGNDEEAEKMKNKLDELNK